MDNHTPTSPKKHPFSRLYARIPHQWEPDVAYRLNPEVARNDRETGNVGLLDDLLDRFRDGYGNYVSATPLLIGCAYYVAYWSDGDGLVLNPALGLADLRGVSAKRARLALRLLEDERVIFRTDAA